MRSRAADGATVLQLTSMESHKYGGLERYLVRLARACRSRGLGTVIQVEERPASEAYLKDLAAEGATVAVCRTTGASLRSIVNVLSLLHSHRPRVVQTHFVTGYALLAIACFARALGVRHLVALEHNPLDGKRTWHRRLAYRRFDHVLGVSEDVSRSLLDAGVPPGLVATHYLGVLEVREADPADRLRLRRSEGIPEDAFVVGSLGYDTPRKGFDILLAAMQQLADVPVEIHAMIIGVDPRSSRLPAMAAALGVDKRVHFLGIRDDGRRILSAFDLYVQPSLSEGLPLGIMEAMSLKLPVIATRVGGIPEAVLEDTTGFLIEPGSVTALVDALRRAISGRERLRSMGEEGGRRYLQVFQGERSVDALAARYGPSPA
jgi:glycosyltransferase involved in cell wall biosynthesis